MNRKQQVKLCLSKKKKLNQAWVETRWRLKLEWTTFNRNNDEPMISKTVSLQRASLEYANSK